jgi:hypothetical protein
LCTTYLESFGNLELEKAGEMRNEKVLHRVNEDTKYKEEGNILQTLKRRKANWIGHMLRWNCLLKYVIEGTV